MVLWFHNILSACRHCNEKHTILTLCWNNSIASRGRSETRVRSSRVAEMSWWAKQRLRETGLLMVNDSKLSGLHWELQTFLNLQVNFNSSSLSINVFVGLKFFVWQSCLAPSVLLPSTRKVMSSTVPNTTLLLSWCCCCSRSFSQISFWLIAGSL